MGNRGREARILGTLPLTQRYKEKVPASPQAPRASLSCWAGAETQNTRVSPESPHPNPNPNPNPNPILAENGPLPSVLTVLPFPSPVTAVPAQPGSLPESVEWTHALPGLGVQLCMVPNPNSQDPWDKVGGGGWGC